MSHHTFPPSNEPHIVLSFRNIPNDSGYPCNQYIIPLPPQMFNNNVSPQSLHISHDTRPFTTPSITFPYLISLSPGSKEKWHELARSVYSWLKDTANERYTDEWRWGVNYFWICYVGSSPSFPFATMDPDFGWDPDLVPLAGEYLYIKTSSVLLETGPVVEHNPMKHLSNWMKLRAQWILNGVDSRSFRRIQTKGL